MQSPIHFLLRTVVLLCLFSSCSNRQVENPLIGKWLFIEGTSNGKPSFEKELERTKYFDRDMTFNISNMNNGRPETTISGRYEVLNKNQFKEILGSDLSVIYEFEIRNDTLDFHGILKLPQAEGGFKNVAISEKWVRSNRLLNPQETGSINTKTRPTSNDPAVDQGLAIGYLIP